MKKITLITLMMLAGFAICVAALNPTGSWKGILTLNDGTPFPLTYKLKADGDKLTGIVETMNGELPITDGKIKGDSVIFNVTYNGAAVLNKGKCYPDSIGLNVTVGEDIYHVTAKKVTDQ